MAATSETISNLLAALMSDDRFKTVHFRCPARTPSFPVDDSRLALGAGQFTATDRWLVCPGIVDRSIGLLPSCYDCNCIDFKSLPQIRR